MGKNTLKRFLGLSVMGSMALALTACGSGDGDNGDTAAEDDDDIEIELLTRMAGTTPQVDVYQGILDEFEEDHPGVTVKDESQGDDSAFNNILKTRRASGNLPNIYRVQGVANLGEYIDNDLLMNMDPIFEENQEWSEGFVQGAIDYYDVPDYEGTYAVPMESGLIGVYYNEQILSDAGIDEFPETWSDLETAIDKLNAFGTIPIALGAKEGSTAGHLHNLITYRWLGTDVAKQLGNREMDWDSPEMIETYEFLEDLVEMDAFEDDVAGIDDNVAHAAFQNGDAAMHITGPWNASEFKNPEETPAHEDINLAKFPYFEEKPEFKDEDMQVISPYMVNGELEGREKELTIELIKELTSAENAKKYAEAAGFIVPRTDVDYDEDTLEPIFIKNLELSSTSTGLAVDLFDYDPIQSMQDRTRDSLVSILSGASPEEAGKEIQSEIDSHEE